MARMKEAAAAAVVVVDLRGEGQTELWNIRAEVL